MFSAGGEGEQVVEVGVTTWIVSIEFNVLILLIFFGLMLLRPQYEWPSKLCCPTEPKR